MGYIITSIIAVVLLIPLVYELPNYVYNRKYAVIGFMRWYTPVYIAVFFTVLAVLVGDGIIMIKLTATLSFKSVRIWIGIVAGLIGLLYITTKNSMSNPRKRQSAYLCASLLP